MVDHLPVRTLTLLTCSIYNVCTGFRELAEKMLTVYFKWGHGFLSLNRYHDALFAVLIHLIYTICHIACSELLEAYSRCGGGAEVIAAQDQWLQEAQRQRLRERESDYSSAGVYI